MRISWEVTHAQYTLLEVQNLRDLADAKFQAGDVDEIMYLQCVETCERIMEECRDVLK